MLVVRDVSSLADDWDAWGARVDNQAKTIWWWWAEPWSGEKRAAVWKLAYTDRVRSIDFGFESWWCLTWKIKRNVLSNEEGNLECW